MLRGAMEILQLLVGIPVFAMSAALMLAYRFSLKMAYGER
jgi:hypothetical protein